MTARKAERLRWRKPPLPRAVRELLRDEVLLRAHQIHVHENLPGDPPPVSKRMWPDSLMKRVAKLLGTTTAAIVERARKAGRR